ncbi:MAG: NAD(P)-dependent oxidoreductase [Clostridia bacterium]|nr:NAD(P)-dependent oxidoreductase [Candidatus Pelethousia sp.]NCB29966.1 NAD(P)-dependent oxidoreductase [Clostridia bacterium]
MKHIGFIGTGVMGQSMVRNLLKSDYSVKVFNRTRSRAAVLEKDGAIVCDSIADCVKGQDAIISIIGFPKDVEEVFFGESGILAHAAKGTYLIDMTTTSPALSQRIFSAAKARGLHALDAPVSGGDSGAKNATLSIMVGGEQEDFHHCMPILQAMGDKITYAGAAGAGQHTKMANQIAIAGAVAGVAEAISYGEAAGLRPTALLDAISNGAAASWQLQNNGYKMVENDFAPGFFIKHFIKDMRIAVEMAEEMELSLPVLQQVFTMYEQLPETVRETMGTQAIIQHYRKDASIEETCK